MIDFVAPVLDPKCLPVRARVRSFGVVIDLLADSDAALAGLLRCVPPTTVPSASRRVDREYAVRSKGRCRCGQAHRSNDLFINGSWRKSGHDLGELAPVLQRNMKLWVAENAPQFVFVHAGAVGWRGRAILVPGSSLSGKTTLTAALLERGATYLSDEYAVLDERGRVHPYAQPLAVRETPNDLQIDTPAEHFGACRQDMALSVAMVIVTRYRSTAHWSARPMRSVQVTKALLTHTVAAQRSPERSMRVVTTVGLQARGYGHVRGEAGATAERILATFDVSHLATFGFVEPGVRNHASVQ